VTGFAVERDDRSAPFFDAGADGRLLIRRCPVCATAHPPQAARCSDSDELEWEEASGDGILVSWAVDHSAPLDPVLTTPGAPTATFGLVELTEGPWLQVPIVEADPVSLREGMAMVVRFVRPGGGEAIPAFTPVI
jgi:uncharacterized OB-fold protein